MCSQNQTKPMLKYAVVLLLLFFVGIYGKAQEQDTAKNYFFNGTISANANGISLIPSFSLGRPAMIFELALGGERLSFEPEMRFAMDARPWSFILWWRYKIVKYEKFKLHIGAHPAFIFNSNFVLDASGKELEHTEVRRFFAGEIAPSYQISKNFKIGTYYLLGTRLDKGYHELNHFVALNGSINNIPISEKLYLNLKPQVFYLRLTNDVGYYVSSTAFLGLKDFPLGIGGLLNRAISTEIQGDDWVWNVSLNYNFATQFAKR